MDSNPIFSSFAEAFVSDGPHPDAPHELMQFGRFVGAWDLNVTYYDESGAMIRQTPGEWHFGWVLEGRAVADVWIVPPRVSRPRRGAPPGEYGMSLRFYDPAIGAWRSTWLGPVHGVVFPFIATEVDSTMRLERREGDRLVRWVFSNITTNGFIWRNLTSGDEGSTWRLEQQFVGRRVGTG